MQEEKTLDIESALVDMGGDREIYKEVLDVFIEDSPKLISELTRPLERNDYETITRFAHSIKSSSRAIGGMRMSALAARLEEMSKDEVCTDMTTLIESIKAALKSLIEALRKEGFNVPVK